MWETWVQSQGWEDVLEKEMATHPVFLPGKSHGQRSLPGCSPWSREESYMTEHAYICVYICTHMYICVCVCVCVCVYTSEKAMAPHSSTLAWKIPWTKEPGRLQSMGSLRVEYDWATSLSLFTFMHWRRKWQPTPVFLPGESQGWGSLVGCRLWGCTESDTTEAT